MNKNIYLVTNFHKNSLKIIKKYAKLKIGFIQLRDKKSLDKHFIKNANKIYKIASKYKVKFIINDRVHLLDKIKCDGFHVGQKDGNHKQLRKKFKNLHMGISVSNYKEAKQAVLNGANLIGVGAIYPTSTKKNANFFPLDSLHKINQLTNEIAIIGGINNININNINIKLYKYVALSSYLLNATSPQKAISDLQQAIKNNY